MAAIREKREVSYDDFLAVAQALVSSGFTNPQHLGVFGTSNGGLLSATVAVERPDLFGAVVSDAPLIDMLRFPSMGMRGAWMNEYGDPSNAAMRQALLRYSPFHNIKSGTGYPPFFITVSTEDNRVGPQVTRENLPHAWSRWAPRRITTKTVKVATASAMRCSAQNLWRCAWANAPGLFMWS